MLKRKDKKNAKQNDWHRAAVMLLVCSLLLSMVPEVMAKKKTSGNIDGTKWSYNTKTKTLTLSCKGRMDDEYSEMHGGYWPWRNKYMQKAVVKEGVTYLGGSTFQYCWNLKQVTLPKSLKEIGTDAFRSSGISKITLPNQLKKIRGDAFSGAKLQEITIPEKVTTIEEYTFAFCPNLKKVTLSPNLKKISQAMFCQCVKLKTITLPKNITRIENGAFYESGLTNITIPKKVATIEKEVFYHCTSLKKVTFETQKLKTISSSLFEGCKKLKTITLPGNVTKIEEKAFKESGLTSITIPEKVTSIGNEAFADCRSLKNIVFEGEQVVVIGSDACKGLSADCIITVPAGQGERMKALLTASGLPESVTVTE